MPDRPVRRALVIGIGDYPGLRQPGLGRTVASAVADARAFCNWLMTERCLDGSNGRLKPEEVFLHLSPIAPDARPCTRDAIKRSIRELHADPSKTELFVYFSGHGFAARMDLVGPAGDYLVLEDFEELAVSADALINISYLTRLLSACGPGTHYYFFDACRNEAVQGGLEGGTLGLAFMQTTAGVPDQFSLFSTRSGAQAAGQSVFAPLLLRALRGEGRAKEWRCLQNDGDEQLVVRFESVCQFVSGEMSLAGTQQVPCAHGPPGRPDIIDVIAPPRELRCTVSFTPPEVVEGATVTARMRNAVADTASVHGGQAVLTLLPGNYQLVPSSARLLFKPALRKESIWEDRLLSPPFEAVPVSSGEATRGVDAGELPQRFLREASALDRRIYDALGDADPGLESMEPPELRAQRIVTSFATLPAQLHLVVPSQAAALTYRVETIAGRPMPAKPARGGAAVVYELPADTYRVQLAEWGATIREQQIELEPGAELTIEPARELERDALHRHILAACGRDGGGLATPEGAVLDSDLALWLPWWAYHTDVRRNADAALVGGIDFGGQPGDAGSPGERHPTPSKRFQMPEHGTPHTDASERRAAKIAIADVLRDCEVTFDYQIVVIAATRRTITDLWLMDATGQNRSSSDGSASRHVRVGDHAVAILWARLQDDRPWVVVQQRLPDGRALATGFAISVVPDHLNMLVVADEASGEPSASLQQFSIQPGDPSAEDRLAQWRALRVAALAQRSLRRRDRSDLHALVAGVELTDLASRNPIGLAALRVLAHCQAARPLVERIDRALASSPLAPDEDRAWFLDSLRDPAHLTLPAGAQLRWDSAVLSFTLPPHESR